jgi:hypothetical protein
LFSISPLNFQFLSTKKTKVSPSNNFSYIKNFCFLALHANKVLAWQENKSLAIQQHQLNPRLLFSSLTRQQGFRAARKQKSDRFRPSPTTTSPLTGVGPGTFFGAPMAQSPNHKYHRETAETYQ